jgi:hypothetical protein
MGHYFCPGPADPGRNAGHILSSEMSRSKEIISVALLHRQ